MLTTRPVGHQTGYWSERKPSNTRLRSRGGEVPVSSSKLHAPAIWFRITAGVAWLALATLGFFLVVSGCAGRPLPSVRTAPPAETESATRSGAFRPGKLPMIRIGLLVHRDSASLTGTGRFRVTDRSSGEVIGTSSSGEIWKTIAKGAWIDVSGPGGAQGLYTGPIQLSPLTRDGRIQVADKEYRGSIEVLSRKNGTLTVVNIVDLEHYLRGVVPREIGRLKANQIEALKAQAVAARTYAVSNLGRRSALGFDLYGTVSDQVYHGYGAEWSIANRAISETRGVIASYRDKPISAFYSSTCGGRTESIEDAWGGGTGSVPARRARPGPRKRRLLQGFACVRMACGMEEANAGAHPRDAVAQPGPAQDG